jgi:hypothetical protein
MRHQAQENIYPAALEVLYEHGYLCTEPPPGSFDVEVGAPAMFKKIYFDA